MASEFKLAFFFKKIKKYRKKYIWKQWTPIIAKPKPLNWNFHLTLNKNQIKTHNKTHRKKKGTHSGKNIKSETWIAAKHSEHDQDQTHETHKVEEEEEEGGKKREAESKIICTLKEELLGCLVGIHGTFFEHCVDFLFTMISCDLLNVLDRFSHTVWDWNPKPTSTHPCNPRNDRQTIRKNTKKKKMEEEKQRQRCWIWFLGGFRDWVLDYY